MSVQVRVIGSKAIISVSGRFVFAAHAEFRQCAQQVLGMPDIEEIEIDLGSAEYLDSAGLGMLLLLQERAPGARKAFRQISGSQGRVRAVLEMCNFNQLFTLA